VLSTIGSEGTCIAFISKVWSESIFVIFVFKSVLLSKVKEFKSKFSLGVVVVFSISSDV